VEDGAVDGSFVVVGRRVGCLVEVGTTVGFLLVDVAGLIEGDRLEVIAAVGIRVGLAVGILVRRH
jgi:hypothetical protein